MELKSTNHEIKNPSPGDIRRVLEELDGEDNHFAILAIDQMTYMQASGSGAAGFVLEYQEGSMDCHYRAMNASIPLEDVAAAFGDYLTQNDHWRSRFQWEKEDLKTAGCGGSAAVVATVVLLFALSAWLVV